VSDYWDQVDAIGAALNAVHEASDDERCAAVNALDAACRNMVGPVTLRYGYQPSGIVSKPAKIVVRDGDGNIEKVVEVFEAFAPAGSTVDIGWR